MLFCTLIAKLKSVSLEELEESGFIRKYTPFGKKERNKIYQLSDFYSLFYIKFIKNRVGLESEYWSKTIDSPPHRVWSGYTFEQVCFSHLPQLKKALGISGVESSFSMWRSETSSLGSQIDLIIDRRDHVINLCEIKFSIHPFTIDKNYDEVLRNKIGTFKIESKTKKAVYLTMITTFGIKENVYSGNVQNSLKMDCLFQ